MNLAINHNYLTEVTTIGKTSAIPLYNQQKDNEFVKYENKAVDAIHSEFKIPENRYISKCADVVGERKLDFIDNSSI